MTRLLHTQTNFVQYPLLPSSVHPYFVLIAECDCCVSFVCCAGT